MELKRLTYEDKQRLRGDILEMMEENDQDFVPPLSQRFSTSQTDFVGSINEKDGLISYLDDMVQHCMLGAFEGDRLIAFVAYKENLVNEVISEDTLPNIYLCTLILRHSARGQRLTQKLYSHLFEVLYPECDVFTRTWSTNLAHLHILDRFGFEEILRKENDRGPGVDTVYYIKHQH